MIWILLIKITPPVYDCMEVGGHSEIVYYFLLYPLLFRGSK